MYITHINIIYRSKHVIIQKGTLTTTGAYAGFLKGGPNFKISGILDIQRSCEPLLGGFGSMPPQEFFLKWCSFVRFEGYFQPLSW